MAGSRDDGTFADDQAHHPNRKVSKDHMTGKKYPVNPDPYRCSMCGAKPITKIRINGKMQCASCNRNNYKNPPTDSEEPQ